MRQTDHFVDVGVLRQHVSEAEHASRPDSVVLQVQRANGWLILSKTDLKISNTIKRHCPYGDIRWRNEIKNKRTDFTFVQRL